MSCCCSRQSQQPETAADGAACDAPPERAGEWMRMVFAALVAGQSMIFGLAASISPPEGAARTAIHSVLALAAIAVFLLVGGPVWKTALAAFARRRIVIEQLFLAGIFGAFFASLQCTLTGAGHIYYEVVAILLAVYSFGQLIGERRREAAIAEAKKIGIEFSTCERVSPDGSTETVPCSEIREGDIVRVPVGAGIPVDGTVRRGVAFVRESALTGEPFPVVKREGDRVLAGSHCLDQALEIESSGSGSERAIDRLLESVRRAQSSKSRLQREADRLVSWFLPVVLAVSALCFAGWTYAAGWETGLFNALAVLVVACPCSMGLATPIGIWSSIASLARLGIVAKDSDLIEALGRADTVVFDKTGTLGEERLDLVDFVCLPEIDREKLLEEVAAVEASSNHPVALGFRRPCGFFASEVATLPGTGIAGTAGGARIEIGNRSLAESSPDVASALRGMLRAGAAGSHEVWVRRDGALAGLGILRERLRESSGAALRALEEMGVRCIVMTGDRADAAGAHGFREVFAGLQPHEKAERVRALQAAGAKVLFVGDGVNDAPAMAEASASIAVGTGSALALETASGEMRGEDLRAIPAALARCRRTLRAIRNNLWFAAFYNAAGISLAAAGLIHPVIAALLMLASSLTVTWQALRETREDESAEPESPPFSSAFTPSEPVLGAQQNRISQKNGAPYLPVWAAWAISLGVFSQGPAVVYLGGFSGANAAGFILLFAAAAAALLFLSLRRPMSPGAGMAATMFSLGGALMLLGWWADAGFGPVVRDGVCLCGCALSPLGWGVFLQPSWMLAGMVAASLPAGYFETDPGGAGRWKCWLAGLAGMLVGMEAAALLMALVPVDAAAAEAHFFATYGSMVLGMTAGMFAACGAWRRLARKRRRA